MSLSAPIDLSLDRDVFGHERRLLLRADLELRQDGETPGRRLHGYASVFESRAAISSLRGEFIESVAPGAFAKSIKEHDIRLLVNHEPSLLLARNRADTLRLSEDERGLRVDADLPETSAGRDIAISLARGDISQMSFGFDKVRDEWNHDTDPPERRLLEVRLHDVSLVTFPAYADTTATVRALRSMGINPDYLRAIRERLPVDHAGDEPPDDRQPTTPATSHLVEHERRMRALSLFYALPNGDEDDVHRI